MTEQEKLKRRLESKVWRDKKKQLEKEGRKTMSVMEMGALLGLKKTDSYWLANKHFFKIISTGGRMRVDIESFEKWYANQEKYQIVGGPPPGTELRKSSYSPRDISRMLGISEAHTYDLIVEKDLPVITVDYRMRIPKAAFDYWYEHQSHYRNAAARKRDAPFEEKTLTMPEMAKILGVSRSTVYSILANQKYEGQFEFQTIAGKKRITKDSFERWYASQDRYWKEEDRKDCERYMARRMKTVPGPSGNEKYYTVDDIRRKYGCSRKAVYGWVQQKAFRTVKTGRTYRIHRQDFDAWYEANVLRGKE